MARLEVMLEKAVSECRRWMAEFPERDPQSSKVLDEIARSAMPKDKMLIQTLREDAALLETPLEGFTEPISVANVAREVLIRHVRAAVVDEANRIKTFRNSDHSSREG